MATHHLKTWPDYFDKVKFGKKTFEIRKNDRDYQVGDILILHEYDNERKQYTNTPEISFIVTYLIKDCSWIIEDYVIMTIKPI